MKLNKLFIILTTVFSLLAISCQKSELKEPYPRNVGEEYLNVSETEMEFLGRGGSLTYTVDASYDGTMLAPDWVILTANAFPGDTRKFKVTAKVEVNKTGADRQGEVTISTPNLTKTIKVSQPAYNRPNIPNPIKSADDFIEFLANAPYVEENEVITIDGNIDLKDKTIAAAEYFNGVLDGQGNSINNLLADCPLFASLNQTGVVRNLTIGAGSKITAMSQEENNSETYTAPFVGKNYGKIENCVNNAPIFIEGQRTAKDYVGGVAAYSYAGSGIKGCVNRGEIQYHPESAAANPYLGGITGYSYGDIEKNGNYGSIICNPGAFSAGYFIGGISPRHETGKLVGNITHKEVFISTNEVISGQTASYIGGIIGYVQGAPVTTANQCYCDIDIKTKNTKDNFYIGALQGWQARVDGVPGGGTEAVLFEGSIVNCNIKAYYKSTNKYGNNPCTSAGFITGRFSGQASSNPATTLHYGTAENPIKVSGSVYCYKSDTKVVATSSDYKALLDGDNSATSVNGGNQPLADYNNIKYEVIGDGQTGPAEELIVTTDNVKVEVPMEGGKASFIFKANYDATLQTANDWLSFSETEAEVEKVLPASDAEQTVDIFAAENTKTTDREGKVSIKLPMGSYKEVTVLQPGNKTLPAELSVEGKELEALPEGSDVTFKVTSNYDAAITTECDWLTIKQPTVKGDYTAQTVTVTAIANDASDAVDRMGTVTVTVKDKVETVTVSQKKFTFTPKEEIASVKDFTDFMKYGGNADLYPAGFNVKLTTDIDLKGVSFDAPASFAGTFNGNGKSIKNWICKAPMFGNLSGTVKNLTIDASCSIELNDVIATFLADNNLGTIENCTNKAGMNVKTKGENKAAIRVAPFAAYNKGTIKGCVNTGAINFGVEVDDGQATYIGGMSGTSIGGTFEDCKNDAPLTLTYTNGTSKHYKRVGGITSACSTGGASSFIRCVNTQEGKLTIVDNNAAQLLTNVYIGGITAESEAKMIAQMKDCKSFGDLYTNINNDNARVAGLVSNLKKWDTEGSIIGEGCIVNCNITAVYTKGVSEGINPLNSCGFVVGRFAGESKTFFVGSPEDPVKYAGTLTKLKEDGSVELTLTASSSTDILTVGAGSGCNINGGNTGKAQGLNVKYEVVTKE